MYLLCVENVSLDVCLSAIVCVVIKDMEVVNFITIHSSSSGTAVLAAGSEK